MLELLKIRQECKDLIWNELHSVSLKAKFKKSAIQDLSIYRTKVELENRETGEKTEFVFIVDKSLLNPKKLQEFKEYVIDCYHEATQKVLFKHEGTYKRA